MKKESIFPIAILFVLFTVLPILAPEKAAAAAKFANGEYSVPFTVLKDTSDEQSTTVDYMVSPAKVTIQNDKTFAVVTLNNSSWWQYFKVQSGKGLTDVQVLSNDTANDKRVVKFEVKDIEQLVDAKIHIIVTGIPNFEYDNKYDIRFKFTSSDIPLAPEAEKPTLTPNPNPNPTQTPSPTAKAAVTPSSKPIENKQTAEAKTKEKQQQQQQSKDRTKEEDKKTEAASTDTSEKDVAVTMDTKETDSKGLVAELSEDIEELAGEESSEITEEVIEKTEVAADTTSKSGIGRTMFIILLAILVIGGVYLLFIRKPSQPEK